MIYQTNNDNSRETNFSADIVNQGPLPTLKNHFSLNLKNIDGRIMSYPLITSLKLAK